MRIPLQRRHEGVGVGRITRQRGHRKRAVLESRPKIFGMQQPGKSARGTRSREHGERHGQTELAHEETEDEGASTRAAAPLNSHRRARHHAHHFALRISPRDERCRVAHNLPHEKLEVPRCTQSAAYLPLGLNSGCASSNFEYPPWVSKPEQQISGDVPSRYPTCPISQTAGGPSGSPRISPSPWLGS